MPKQGILHDYDLYANLEKSAVGVKCAVCDADPTSFQWADLSGEAMCRTCGCSYQLKWGTKEQEEKGEYPHLNISLEYLPVARKYWEETGRFVCYGRMLGHAPGVEGLVAWLEKYHPEHIKKEPT